MDKLFPISFLKRKFNSFVKLVKWKLHPFTEVYRKKGISRQIKYYTQQGILPVDLGSDVGIGAKLLWYLQIAFFCDERNIKPYIKFTYDDDRTEDYFERYLISKYPKNSEMKYIRINRLWDLDFGKNYDKERLDIEMATKLTREYINIRPEFIDEVNKFVEAKFNTGKVLGVHFRSTDKITEAGYVSYEMALRNIDNCLNTYNHFTKIFVTTDDNKFIDYLKNSRLTSLICYREDFYRSDNEKAIHTRMDIDRYNMNKDAIINMIILSKCDFIIKTASNLSAISLFLNPSIPYMLINKMHNLYFPDNEFLIKSTLRPMVD